MWFQKKPRVIGNSKGEGVSEDKNFNNNNIIIYNFLEICPEMHVTVEPRFNEVAGDRLNLFVKWRVRYIEVLFHTFYCNFGRDIEIISFVISRTSLNRGSLKRGSTVMRFIFLIIGITKCPHK